MARRSRRGRKSGGNATSLLVGIGALVLIGIGVALFSGNSSENGKIGKPQDFNIAEYRQDGSRFASSGNRYVLEGKVENIETRGDDRVVAISMKGNPRERLPLLVPGSAKLSVNLTRGDTFIFELSCRTGRDADGNEVRGILVVNNVETK